MNDSINLMEVKMYLLNVRYGFPTKEDYNDNESYCGGLTVQQQKNGGKCGVCGDPWHRPQVSRGHRHDLIHKLLLDYVIYYLLPCNPLPNSDLIEFPNVIELS